MPIVPPEYRCASINCADAYASCEVFTSDAGNRQPDKKQQTPERLSIEQARRTAASFAHGQIGAVQVVDTDAGSAIVAVLKERKTGTTRFIVLEKHAGRYRITARGPLDGEGFHRATWGSEVVDADEDGYQEVLFSGRDSRESRTQRRLILFVPNDRRTYSMLMTGETTPNGTPRIIWLANAAGTDAAAYRTALRKKARALVMIAKNPIVQRMAPSRTRARRVRGRVIRRPRPDSQDRARSR